MNSYSNIRFGREEALALLQKLRKSDETQYSSEACRLFFVDVDVLSTYVNGKNSNIRSEWSSLFSLTDRLAPDQTALVDEDDHVLSDAIARSITGFLFGHFRESRKMQGGRLWMTPEHSRELDSLVHAVLAEQIPALGGWQKALYDRYLELANCELSTGDAEIHLNGIFQLLRDSTAAGKVARTYEIRRRFTSTLTQLPVFPPKEAGRPFSLRADVDSFARIVERYASRVLELIIDRTVSAIRDRSYDRAIETTYRLAFEARARGLEDREISRNVLKMEDLWGLVPKMPSMKEQWLRGALRIALRGVSDAFSLARIIATSELLANSFPLALPYDWRVCLVSGSRIFEELMDGLRSQGIGDRVEIVHPLSVMRFDEFLTPLAESMGEESPGAEYALTVLRDPDGLSQSLNAERFFKSLSSLLTASSAGFAFKQDGALNKLHRVLRSDEKNLGRIVRAVGNAVSTEYLRTLLQLVSIETPRSDKLSVISTPWVSLPLPALDTSPAERFVRRLHGIDLDGVGRGAIQEADFAEILRSDSTGYTAGLCAALGYLRMSADHLFLAELSANIAVRTASLDGDERGRSEYAYVPEGNEAFYLAAFISRMRVRPAPELRGIAEVWRDQHSHLLSRARETCHEWVIRYPEMANRPSSARSMKAYELILLRYDVEDMARKVWCSLLDLLVPRQMDGVSEAGLLSDFGPDVLKTEFIRVIERVCKDSDGSHLEKCDGELGFVFAQLTVTAIQYWICERVRLERIGGEFLALKGLELAISKLLAFLPKTSDSLLVAVLVGVFRVHGVHSGARDGRGSGSFQFDKLVPFAAIDSVRAGFLERLLRLKAGGKFEDAVQPKTATLDR